MIYDAPPPTAPLDQGDIIDGCPILQIVNSGMKVATQDEFCKALDAYRTKWPGDGYFDAKPRFTETFRLLRELYEGGRILDVGGWPGDFSCTLALMGFEVLLLDKDLSRATTKLRDEATGQYVLGGATTLIGKCRECGVETVQCDLEHEPIPLDDHSVGFIVFTEVIEHLRKNLLFALREMRRVLKPGGRLLVTTPNLLSLRNRVSFLTGRTSYDTLEMPYDALAAEERVGHGGHFRVFSMPEVVDLLERTGFRVAYRGYRQILPSNGMPERWSFYQARTGLMNGIAKWIKPLGNTLFLVASRDGRAESGEQRAESGEQRAESGEQRAESGVQRAEGGE